MNHPPQLKRVAFVDDLRGVAVLCMIAWHTTDAWLLPTVRSGTIYQGIRLFGGLTAPLFLFLAGAGFGLSWSKRPTQQSQLSLLVRGLQIVVFGYALRLQMWLIDAMAIARPDTLVAWAPMLLGLMLALWGLSGRKQLRNRWLFCMIAAALYALGLFQVSVVAPSRLQGLLRVDVLQAIGISIALLAAFARSFRWEKRAWLAVFLGIVVTFLTPWLQRHMPWVLPEPIAGYIARWATPQGGRPMAMFPLFPWLGYALVGLGVSVIWSNAKKKGRLTTAVTLLAICGATIVVGTSEYHPYVYQTLQDHPDLTQLFRMAYRVGLILVMAIFVYAFSLLRVNKNLCALGQTSLVIYWIHLEFVFGLLGTPLRKTLTLTTWSAAFCVLSIAMIIVARMIRARNPK